MTNAEIRWTNYLGKHLPYMSEEAVDIFIKNQANSVCQNLALPMLYPEAKDKYNPLKKIMLKHLHTAENLDNKGAFFEGNVVDYAKNNLKIDF